MGAAGILYVAIRGDAADLRRELRKAKDDTVSAARDMRQGMIDFEKSVVSAGAKVAAIGVAAGLAALTYGIKEAVQAASDLQETTSKFQVVFAGQERAANQFASTLRNAYGMSTNEARGFLASMQDLFVPMGLAKDKAADLSFEVVKLATDLGSFNNLKTADVMSDMQSAFVGNYETMKKYGVVLTATAVEQKALEMGLAATKNEITQNDKVMAAYELITKSSAAAIGDFSRTQDGAANQTKIMRSNVSELLVVFGQKLLPVYNEGLKVFNKFTSELLSNREEVTDLTQKGLGGLVDGFAAVVKAMRYVETGWIGLKVIGTGAVAGIAAGIDGLLYDLQWLAEGLKNLGLIKVNPFDAWRASTAEFAAVAKQAMDDQIKDLEETNQKYDEADRKIEAVANRLKELVKNASDTTGAVKETTVAMGKAGDVGAAAFGKVAAGVKSADKALSGMLDTYSTEYPKIYTQADFIYGQYAHKIPEYTEKGTKGIDDMNDAISDMGSVWDETFRDMEYALSRFLDASSDSFLNFGVVKGVGQSISGQIADNMASDIVSMVTGKTGSAKSGLNVQDLWGGAKNIYGMFGGGSAAAGSGTPYGAYASYINSGASSAGAGAGGGAAMGMGIAAIIAAVEMLANSLNQKSGRSMVQTSSGKYYNVGLADETGLFNDPAMEWLSGTLYGKNSTHSGGAYASAAFQEGDWEGVLKGLTAMAVMGPLTSALLGNPIEKALGLGNIKRAYLGQERTYDYNADKGTFGLLGTDTYESKRGGYDKFGQSTADLSKWFVNNINAVVETIRPAMQSLSTELSKEYEEMLKSFGNEAGKIQFNWFIGAESDEEFQEDFDRIKEKPEKLLKNLTKKSIDMYVDGLREALQGDDSDKALSILSEEARTGFTGQLDKMLEKVSFGNKEYTSELKEFSSGITEVGAMVSFVSELNRVYDEATTTLERMLRPLTEWEEETGNLNTQTNAFLNTLSAMGVAEEKLTDIDKKRLEVIDKLNTEYAQKELSAIISPILAEQNKVAGNFSSVASDIAFRRSGTSRENYLIGKLNAAQAAGDVESVSELANEWYRAAVQAEEEKARINQDLLESQKNVATRWENVAATISGLRNNINDTRLGIMYSGLNVSTPTQRLASAGYDYNSMLQSAKSMGNTSGLESFTGFLQTYLSEAQGVYKSSDTYVSDYFNKSFSDLRDLENLVQSNEYERAVFERDTAEATRYNTEEAAVKLDSIDSQFLNFQSWSEQYEQKKLAYMETQSETLKQILESEGKPIEMSIMLDGQALDIKIDQRADRLIVNAMKSGSGKLSQV